MEYRKCVFAGTFDPPTVGHEQVIKKCLEIFDEVVVAVMINREKTPFLSAEERLRLLNTLFKGEKRVKVKAFSGAAVDVLNEENTRFYVRGVRNTVDFEYENINYYSSKKLKEDMIVLYFPAEQSELHISSTLVKNSLAFKKELFGYVPEKIKNEFMKIAEKKNV